jgi:hypothetical protein
VLVSDDEQDALSTDPDELLDSDDSDGISGDEEDIFQSLLARAGFHLSYGDSPPLLLDPSQLQVMLREKLLMDAGAVAAFLAGWCYNCLRLLFHSVDFLFVNDGFRCWCQFDSATDFAGLRVYLDDPVKVKRLLLPTKITSANVGGKNTLGKGEAASPSLMNLLMGVKVLQQAIVDLLLDIMVECCQPSEAKKSGEHQSDPKTRGGLSDGNSVSSILSCDQVFRTYSPEDHTIGTLYQISRIGCTKVISTSQVTSSN